MFGYSPDVEIRVIVLTVIVGDFFGADAAELVQPLGGEVDCGRR